MSEKEDRLMDDRDAVHFVVELGRKIERDSRPLLSMSPGGDMVGVGLPDMLSGDQPGDGADVDARYIYQKVMVQAK